MKRAQKTQATQYPTDLVFAAACAADRINVGIYQSASQYTVTSASTNKSLMLQLLSNALEITEQDHAKASLVRKHYQGLTFKLLGGKSLSDFDSKALELASSETVSDRDISVVAYLPVGYARAIVIKTAEQRLRDCESAYCGTVGSKVTLELEIIKKSYSQNYGCYFISAITKDNLAVFFATSDPATPFELNKTYKVTAKVKAHQDNSVTKLNYVKLAKIA